MASVIKAPNEYINEKRPYIFLAGSIELGAAPDWQALCQTEINNGTILNPRRLDWDSSWIQSIDNPKFREQVEWELTALETSDLILMHFDQNAKSPISLLELGLFKHKNIIVHCPSNFWRKGNVDVVCKRYGIRQVDTIFDLMHAGNDFVQNYLFKHSSQKT